MDTAKREKLEAAGYTVTTVEDFLDLSPAEAALVEARLAEAELTASPREPSAVRRCPGRKGRGRG